jgi:hypothetical protein
MCEKVQQRENTVVGTTKLKLDVQTMLPSSISSHLGFLPSGSRKFLSITVGVASSFLVTVDPRYFYWTQVT